MKRFKLIFVEAIESLALRHSGTTQQSVDFLIGNNAIKSFVHRFPLPTVTHGSH